MSKYGILILPRLSVNFTLNSRECNKNLTNQKIKAIQNKNNTLYYCVEVKICLHIGGNVYGNYSEQQKETSQKNFSGID